jgi:hypothetical protein|eukprot:SAG25_NODE_2547_length_1539_cov_1.219444_2_plen_102_part_00
MASGPLHASVQGYASDAAATSLSTTKYPEALWDVPMAVLHRVGDGLVCTKELAKFFRRRASAEEDLAKNMRKMCLVRALATLLGWFVRGPTAGADGWLETG